MPVTSLTENDPNRHFRIDSFSVPAASVPEFETAMRRNMAFIEKLPGFLGHIAFEKEGGPSAFNIVTIAIWESKTAFDNAVEKVRAYYQEINFDGPTAMARWGVTAEIGNYNAPARLQ